MLFSRKGPSPLERLLQLDASPHAMGVGVASGLFYGLSPFFGVKTVMSMVTSWIFRGHVLAAGLVVTLLDVILPLLPIFLGFASIIGHLLLQMDTSLSWTILFSPWENRLLLFHQLDPLKEGLLSPWTNRILLLRELWPMTLGCIILNAPLVVITYFLTVHFWEKRIKRIKKEMKREKKLFIEHELQKSHSSHLHKKN